LNELAQQNQNVKVLRFSRNIGADKAIFFGLQHAKGDAVILIQADLQDPPELLPDFIKGWEAGNDVVFGKVTDRQENIILKNMRRFYYRTISRLSDIPIPRGAGEFRLTSRRALDCLLEFNEQDLYIRGAVAQVGFKQQPVFYVRQERAGGTSSVNFLYLIGYALNGLLSTTVVPIRIVTICGISIALLGFILTVIIIISKLLLPGAPPHGFTTLASLIIFFSGVQMLSIGIIGEYVKKTYLQSLNRPKGFIQDKVNF
jgi:glycosyltransferase involved in cell wall biosynthesis